MGFKNSCGCCSCEDTPIHEDDFSTTKTGYLSTTAGWSVADGRLKSTIDGAYYREISTGGLENLRMVVSVRIYETLNVEEGGTAPTRLGIFIGGIASLYAEKIATSVYRLYFGVGCDQFGNNPSQIIDLIWPAYAGLGHVLRLEIEHDWNNAGRYFIRATGSEYGQYAASFTTTLTSPVNVGILGDGQYDNLWIVRNHNANRCLYCLQCKPKEIPKTLLLSVPELATKEDGVCYCDDKGGNFILRYKTYLNTRTCIFQVNCGYCTDEVGGCGGDYDTCGPAPLWQLSMEFSWISLRCTNAIEIMEYRTLYTNFNCDGPTVLYLHREPWIPEDHYACDNQPDTLTVVPI